VTSFADNISGCDVVKSGLITCYPFSGHVNDSRGNIQTAWRLGGTEVSALGNQVMLGYLDADPNLKVFSDFDSYQQQSLVTTNKRYGQHEYSLNLDDNNKQQALSLYNQAHELENQQKYAEAISLMRQALQLDPNYDFYFLYTSYLIRLAKLSNNADYSYDEALQFATHAIAINPNEGRNYVEATVAAYYAQKFDLTRQYGQKAIAFGSTAIGNDNYDLVTQILELVQPSKQQALSLYNQAHELENQQKYVDAIPLMKQALELDPSNDFYFLYTSYLIRSANLLNNADYSYDEALQFATRAIAINPNEGRNYAEATVAAYYAQEFDLVQQYGQKAIVFGSAAIGNYYDLVNQILEWVQPHKYTINLDLNPNNPYVQKKDGLLYIAIPTSNLPYQREVKYRLEGAKLVKQTVENGNESIYLTPQTSPFRAIFEVTKISYSYKKQLSNYNQNASLPADTLEYLKPTDMVNHNSAKVQAVARTLTGKDDLQSVTNILGWLKTNMRYAYEGQIDYNTIDELIDLGAAQCSGYSDIFAALARANGIPTRSVRGLAEAGDKSYFAPAGYLVVHSWNEFYLRNVGWIPVEPQTPGSIGEVYTRYIRMGHYSMSSDYDLSPLLNLEVLNGIPSACGATCAAFVKQAVSVSALPEPVVGSGCQSTSDDTLPICDLEPAADEVPINYYRDDATGDVWGPQPAWKLPSPPGKLPTDLWKYGLRSIYLAKYACQDAGIRDWMPTNIANGVYYCTNPQDKQKTISYLRTLAAKLTAENRASSTRTNNRQPVSPIEPGSGEVPIDYYRDPTTGDVWGQQPAWQIPVTGTLPQNLWKYGLRSLYLAKYACQDAGVRDWMPTNIANGIYYCTNPQDRAKTISYLLSLADKLEKE
jgi:transglutaminase-like putative cysteine protease/ubiquitin